MKDLCRIILGITLIILSSCITIGGTGALEFVRKTAVKPPEPANPAVKLNQDNLSKAIQNAFGKINPLIPNKSKIAIVNISSGNSVYDELVVEDLTVLLVNAQKYIVVDRKTLDAVRDEQHFQMGGEVDDSTVIGIGHLIGAEFVITGDIFTAVDTNRLRIRVLDVKTGQIIAIASENI